MGNPEEQCYKSRRSVVPVSKKPKTWTKTVCWSQISLGTNGVCFCLVKEADGMS